MMHKAGHKKNRVSNWENGKVPNLSYQSVYNHKTDAALSVI